MSKAEVRTKEGWHALLGRVKGITTSILGQVSATVESDDGERIEFKDLYTDQAKFFAVHLFEYVLVIGRASWSGNKVWRVTKMEVGRVEDLPLDECEVGPRVEFNEMERRMLEARMREDARTTPNDATTAHSIREALEEFPRPVPEPPAPMDPLAHLSPEEAEAARQVIRDQWAEEERARAGHRKTRGEG